MPKWVNTAVLDRALSEIATANLMVAIAGQPATFAAAQTGKLAESAMVPGDYTLSAGSPNGRAVSVAGKSGLPVIAGGTADHVALLDTVGLRLLYVTTAPAQLLQMGGSVAISGWNVTIANPV